MIIFIFLYDFLRNSRKQTADLFLLQFFFFFAFLRNLRCDDTTLLLAADASIVAHAPYSEYVICSCIDDDICIRIHSMRQCYRHWGASFYF